MKRNVGGTDQLIRILLAMVIMAVGFYNPDYWWTFIIGVTILMSAIGSLCLLYSILGISTCTSENCKG
jgi:hypothetical protein